MSMLTYGRTLDHARPEAGPAVARSLTQRETEIVAHLVQGKSLAQIAADVHRSIETVKTHCRSLMRKLGARNRADVIRLAYQNGLATPWTVREQVAGALPVHLWSLIAEALVQGPVPLAVFSPRLQVLYQTAEFARIFTGTSTQQSLVGLLQTAKVVDHDERCDDHHERTRCMHESRRLSVRLPDSATIELTCSPLRSESNGLLALLVTARDLTELFRLQEQATSLRVAAEASTAGRDREMEALRKTASLEISRRARYEQRLGEVFDALTPAAGADFAAEMCRRLRSALDAHIVLVCERSASAADAPRILAGATPTGPASQNDERYHGHLVRCLLGNDLVHHGSGAGALFPDDALVQSEEIEAVLSVPIIARDGSVRGSILLLDRAPRPAVADIMPMLRLCASRAAIEIECRTVAQQLRASHGRLRTLDDAAPIPMIQLDASRACISKNAAFESLTGLGSPRAWSEHLDTDSARRLDEALASMSSTRRAQSLDLTLLTREGGSMSVRAEIGASFGPGGVPSGYVLAFVRAA